MQDQSGVNLDEEMANMLVFQKSYAASARIITTASDMFDELMAAF
jgi:flagellar hook-associated protein 1 FlgK